MGLETLRLSWRGLRMKVMVVNGQENDELVILIINASNRISFSVDDENMSVN